ncbi:hypothetical protein GW750_06940 [bacterium]|nr:hypothetical protein [bacterium]
MIFITKQNEKTFSLYFAIHTQDIYEAAIFIKNTIGIISDQKISNSQDTANSSQNRILTIKGANAIRHIEINIDNHQMYVIRYCKNNDKVALFF